MGDRSLHGVWCDDALAPLPVLGVDPLKAHVAFMAERVEAVREITGRLT